MRLTGRPTGRLLLRTGLFLVLVVALVHVAGGWYFAGQIHQDALRVRHDDPVRSLELTEVGGGRVSVRDPAERPELRSAGEFGLSWPGGYGLVSGRAVVDGDVVTRAWATVRGRPRADLRVSLDQSARPDPPRAPGEVERRFDSPALGTLTARVRPGRTPGNDTWAVLVHGKGADAGEMERLADSTTAAGLTTMMIGYRNDAGLPRDPSGEYGFGATEWRDLAAAVADARRQGARRFVLGGASMGGAIVASYLRHTHDPRVVGLVLDAPMLDFGRTIEEVASHRVLPASSIPLPASLTWTAQRLATLRYGVDWDRLDYLSDPDWASVPTLVFHGDRDTTVPLSTSRDLARTDPDVRLVVVRGAGHVQSWNLDQDRYDREVRALLRRVD